LIFFVVVAGTGWALSGWLARDVLKFPHLWLLRGAIVGAIGLNLLACGRGLFEACQKFIDVALVTAITGALRLIAVAALLAAASLTPSSALFIYLAVPALGLLFALPRLPGVALSRPASGDLSRERKELLAFGGWFGVLTACSSIAGYLDMTFINRAFDSRAVGFYAAAYRLASVFLMLSFPLTSVLKARASTFQTTERLESYLGKAKISAVLAGLGVLAVWAAAPMIVRLCLGPSYEASTPLLRILAVGTGVMFASAPFMMAFYSFGRSRALAVLGPTHIVVFFLALKILVPRLGIAGAAWAFSLTQSILFLLTLILVKDALKKQPSS
jgi:O-antigen/teichoic acid export membrane protein